MEKNLEGNCLSFAKAPRSQDSIVLYQEPNSAYSEEGRGQKQSGLEYEDKHLIGDKKKSLLIRQCPFHSGSSRPASHREAQNLDEGLDANWRNGNRLKPLSALHAIKPLLAQLTLGRKSNMAATDHESTLPTVLEGQISPRIAKTLRRTSGEMKRVASNPDLVINRPHSPLPSSPISRRASPGNLGTSRDVHIANRPCVFRKISSPLASPSSPVMSTRRRRTLSESNKPELLSPVIPKRIMAKTVSSPVQTRKPLMSQATPCPESNVSPPISPVSSPWEPSFVPPKSRPATPYISSASPPLHAPENKDRLPHIAQSHNPRLVRPLSPIRMPLDSNRGLFNISPVLGARESESNGDECESCCDLQEKVNNFLQSMSLEEN